MANEFTSDTLKRLSDADLAVADGEPDVRGWTVVTLDGRDVGEVDDLIVDTDAMKVRYLQLDVDDASDSDDVYVPIADAEIDRAQKRVVLRGSLTRLPQFALTESADYYRRTSTGGDGRRLTRAEEEVRISKRAVEAGEVRVGKHVETEHKRENVTVTRDDVHVERRPVSDGRAADIRASDAEIRVPIVEEEVVVEKHPVVKEELIAARKKLRRRDLSTLRSERKNSTSRMIRAAAGAREAANG